MSEHGRTKETEANALSGWIALLLVCALLAIGMFCTRGFFTLQPNEAVVLVFLGSYAGTCRESGFHWVNPFHRRKRVSLRAQNLTTATLKVNDQRGNPIEIAAMVVWRVQDAARALFEVEDCVQYVRLQCETALRELASRHAYDSADEPVLGGRARTLRGDGRRVGEALRTTIQSQLETLGIVVEDARLGHLAYAPEIAHAMLRRQQAEAVLAARRRLVEGAVGMVELALIDINEKSLANVTQEQRVALVTNLMTVLVGDEKAQPVLQMARAE